MTDKCTSPEGHVWEINATGITYAREWCFIRLPIEQAEAILNEHAALKMENEGLRELFIDLLATQGLVTAKREVEIPEELSATLDIGLPLARRIVDALLTAEEQE